MPVESEPASGITELLWRIYHHVREGTDGIYEGGSSAAQAEYLRRLAGTSGALAVAEIGFNLGFSSLAFLESSPRASVVSFELDNRPCVRLAKEFIDEHYRGRHELILGDSLEAVPRYAEQHGAQFDLVFIDGGHEHDVAAADIRHCARIAKPGAIVVVDDLAPWWPWGAGPAKAWYDAVADGVIEPIEYLLDGAVVERIEGPGDRAWGMGRFPAAG